MLRAVLVDLFGTLVADDGEAVAAACARVPGADPDRLRAAWDQRLWDLAEPVHGDSFRRLDDLTAQALIDVLVAGGRTPDEAAGIAGPLCAGLRERWRTAPLFPDARRFLDAVFGLGLRVCLVSDADRDDVDALLALHGLALDAVVTSEDARAYKPRPEPFELALATLGCTADEVVHVGDSAACDVAGARALGIVTVHLRRP